MELNVPVLALSQLSRAVESRPDQVPRLSDLRESGAIEQDADVVMFIHRDDKFNFQRAQEEGKANLAQLMIAKHRNGPLGTISLRFDPEVAVFRAIDQQRSQ